MALDITGIHNRGEFYSHHYLSALLESDLKPLLKRWAEAESATPPVRAPHKRLDGLAGRYFAARSRAADLGAHAPEEAYKLAAGVHALLLDALGYERAPTEVVLDEGGVLPLAHAERRGGNAYLWVLETGFPPAEDEDPLDQAPVLAQRTATEGDLVRITWRELLDRHVFRQEDAPTWVLFMAGREVVLTHRHKWGRGQALAFDLDDLYARRKASAFRAMTGLLHADALCPAGGDSLHDSLEESSHKHAFAVSTDLRRGAQEAIELLGNEAVHWFRGQRSRDVALKDIDPAELTRECLTWLYRLIFLFYVESRSEELGVAPMRSEAYRRGYSLESLRALETVPLTTPSAQEGFYLDASLRRLFDLLNQGHPKDAQLALEAGIDTVAFRIFGLKSRLFDDKHTPLLARVRFRNKVLQEVVRLLSLSEEGSHKQRGRISYATLGINQLGAVYEGLLAYTGFFTKVALMEVANARENGKPDARTFFVPLRDRELYEDEEIVLDDSGRRVEHEAATYLFRLSGREREKSASYYTPEVLTRCLVKYTLRERMGVEPTDETWLTADELLDLTICEPAMGSGAFLNEVVSQLAHAYLERKQAEVGEAIPSEAYERELARVKARLAHQCYGVDLNPLAAELGKVSLWLNTLRPGTPAPFLDARLAVGNSLVGARLATYGLDLLHKRSKKAGASWLDVAPTRLQGERPADEVYHFLLPAEGMAAFDKDKVVKGLVPEDVARIKAWRKTLNKAWSKQDKERLLRLSAVVDRLWAEHAAARQAALDAIDQREPVWPHPQPPARERLDEEALDQTWRVHMERDLAGQRLKAAMDTWCALWLWPVQVSALLPTRQQWLDDLELLLAGKRRADLETASDEQARRLRVVKQVVERGRFLHWEWQFPEVMGAGGFDVVVGNPPWVKLQWAEGGILSDLDPRMEIRRLSAKAKADLRKETLEEDGALGDYLAEFEELMGAKSFLNSLVGYPLLQGVQTNLYKAFLTRSWELLQPVGCGGLFHQAGVFDDPKGGMLRAHLYPRLRFAALAKNQLKLFEGVHHERPYCFTVWTGGEADEPHFRYISNLFHPRTIDESLAHDGRGEVPGIKTPEGHWDLRGHRSRVVEVDAEALGLFARLYDPPGTPALEARLPVVHSAEVLEVLRKFALAEHLGPNGQMWQTTREWHEGDRTADGTIVRKVHTPESPTDVILAGPHFFVGNPLFKTPRPQCRHNQDYDVVDLMEADGNYLPRTIYSHSGSPDAFPEPRFLGRSIFSYYRHVHREMCPPTGMRSLAPAITPAGAANVHAVFGMAFASVAQMVRFNGMCCSVPVDFFVKSTGSAHVNVVQTAQLPLPCEPWSSPITTRALRLNCLTTHYADLWRELYTPAFRLDTHTKPDPRLPDWTHLGPEWTWDTPLRTPFARRQALVELDALAALALGLTADELCLVYRIQFPVLQQYEADTWYDRRGRIVFTNNRGLSGVGLTRKEWDELKGAAEGPLVHRGVEELPEWARDALGPYEPPFDRCDREADMRQAYAEFEERLAQDS